MLALFFASLMALSSAPGKNTIAPVVTPLVARSSAPITVVSLVAPLVATSSVSIHVPFFSQFRDITSPQWQKVGCGITSLAMIIDFYKPDAVSTNTLLKQGVAAGAYDYNAGWIYAGLIDLSKRYGLNGAYINLSTLTSEAAYTALAKHLQDGPVIASVHYKFDPKSTIPHLVVLNSMKDDVIYYNDPAAKVGQKSIAKADFLKGWKKKIIEIRPSAQAQKIALGTH